MVCEAAGIVNPCLNGGLCTIRYADASSNRTVNATNVTSSDHSDDSVLVAVVPVFNGCQACAPGCSGLTCSSCGNDVSASNINPGGASEDNAADTAPMLFLLLLLLPLCACFAVLHGRRRSSGKAETILPTAHPGSAVLDQQMSVPPSPHTTEFNTTMNGLSAGALDTASPVMVKELKQGAAAPQDGEVGLTVPAGTDARTVKMLRTHSYNDALGVESSTDLLMIQSAVSCRLSGEVPTPGDSFKHRAEPHEESGVDSMRIKSVKRVNPAFGMQKHNRNLRVMEAHTANATIDEFSAEQGNNIAFPDVDVDEDEDNMVIDSLMGYAQRGGAPAVDLPAISMDGTPVGAVTQTAVAMRNPGVSDAIQATPVAGGALANAFLQQQPATSGPHADPEFVQVSPPNMAKKGMRPVLAADGGSASPGGERRHSAGTQGWYDPNDEFEMPGSPHVARVNEGALGHNLSPAVLVGTESGAGDAFFAAMGQLELDDDGGEYLGVAATRSSVISATGSTLSDSEYMGIEAISRRGTEVAVAGRGVQRTAPFTDSEYMGLAGWDASLARNAGMPSAAEGMDEYMVTAGAGSAANRGSDDSDEYMVTAGAPQMAHRQHNNAPAADIYGDDMDDMDEYMVTAGAGAAAHQGGDDLDEYMVTAGAGAAAHQGGDDLDEYMITAGAGAAAHQDGDDEEYMVTAGAATTGALRRDTDRVRPRLSTDFSGKNKNKPPPPDVNENDLVAVKPADVRSRLTTLGSNEVTRGSFIGGDQACNSVLRAELVRQLAEMEDRLDAGPAGDQDGQPAAKESNQAGIHFATVEQNRPGVDREVLVAGASPAQEKQRYMALLGMNEEAETEAQDELPSQFFGARFRDEQDSNLVLPTAFFGARDDEISEFKVGGDDSPEQVVEFHGVSTSGGGAHASGQVFVAAKASNVSTNFENVSTNFV